MNEATVTRRSVLGTARAAEGEASSSRLHFSVEVVEDPAALADFVPAWEALARSAVEPNVFYEPWMLLPAIRAFGAGHDLRFVFVQARDAASPSAKPTLCGFFPLERQSRYRGLATALPFATLGLWKHPLCYLCTPLLRAEHASECLDAFFEWLAAADHGCPLLELGFVAGDGPFWQILSDHAERQARPYHVSSSFLRALFRPRGDAETYVRTALHRFRRKEFKRLERRLAESGRLEYAALEGDGDVDGWIEEFLQAEANSWKGKGGRALASSEADREYFVTIAREAFRRGQLMLLSLRFDGRVIAHKCNFLSPPGSFAFKIAFDEEFARHSPGVLLELENVRLLHARPELQWMDSCADADRFMINHLWPDRRTILSAVMPTGRSPGGLVVAAIPLLKWIKRRLRRG